MRMFDLPLLWLLVFAVLTGLSTILFPQPFPFATGMPGLLFMAAGLGLLPWALAVMRQARTTPNPHGQPSSLVVHGPFAISRHPIYLGFLAVLLGLTLWWQAWAGLILAPAFVLLIDRRFIVPEEKRLSALFGSEYQIYKLKTRRWF